MAASLATVTAAPEDIRIGGVHRLLYPLRLIEWGRYERWYQGVSRRAAEDLGQTPALAIWDASLIRGEYDAARFATVQHAGARAVTWLGLRGAMSHAEVVAEISPDELQAACGAYILLNFGPTNPNPPPKKPDDEEPTPANWMQTAINLRKRGWRFEDVIQLTLPQLWLAIKYETWEPPQFNSGKEAAIYGEEMRAGLAAEW